MFKYYSKKEFVGNVWQIRLYLFTFRPIASTQLKMLGLYLYTLIISHKSCKMLSILKKVTLQKDLQNFVTNNVFMDKK